jgi:hypothetical protein
MQKGVVLHRNPAIIAKLTLSVAEPFGGCGRGRLLVAR